MARKSKSPLARLRAIQQLTQRELAQALGVTDDTVANWEKGRAIPRLTIRQVRILLKVLECTIDELPDDFGPPESQEED
ncbi:helix-turn-helix transcriptional regulator [Leptolyngbya sp. FACHB-261]|uniref:helix-turn-helix transcriptional regulator n=1 Tax=Leptolyngbya sp. FACHB-261 TaxID=2692806 RepID=UPI001682068A|nr:helix-turn-helix transcriptional regulator [Leptolyngbya sp. FACHB-261]MBD2099460.1 helix-turn-helix transcriptional regulator [Leptolyngbya sp. FACHB-261]